MADLDIKNYAQKIIKVTDKLAANFSFAVPVKRLRAMAHHILGEDQEPEKLPPLTDVEGSVLQAIKADFQEGRQPTVRTIAERLEYKTPSSAQVVVNRLIKHGYIVRKGSKKQITVVPQH